MCAYVDKGLMNHEMPIRKNLHRNKKQHISFTSAGLSISGTHRFTVGDSATLTCTNNLDVARSTMQWIWYHRGNTTTLDTTVGRRTVVLELNPVTVEMHGTQLTCKVTSTNGVQEKSISVAVEGKIELTCESI